MGSRPIIAISWYNCKSCSVHKKSLNFRGNLFFESSVINIPRIRTKCAMASNARDCDLRMIDYGEMEAYFSRQPLWRTIQLYIFKTNEIVSDRELQGLGGSRKDEQLASDYWYWFDKGLSEREKEVPFAWRRRRRTASEGAVRPRPTSGRLSRKRPFLWRWVC